MADWVVDRSIPVLFGQVDTAAPGRNKGSDGTIGDADHQARESDHNPESPPPPGNPDDQVDAADITHDPAHGADMGVVAESIRKSRDRRVRYVIFNRRIFYGYDRPGLPAFTWTTYSGSDPHSGHMHVSVNDVHHDETQLWQIGIGMADSPQLTTTNWRILEGMLQLKDLVNDHVNKAPQPNEMARILRRIEASSAQSVRLVGLLAEAIKAGGGNLDTVAVLARIDERAAEDAARDTAAAARIAELEADVARLEAELAAVPDDVADELHQRTES